MSLPAIDPLNPRRPPVLDAARTALIPLRPLTMGEILDGGFAVVRRNAQMMVGLPLVVAGGTAAYLLLGLGLYLLLGNATARWAQILFTVLMGLAGLFVLIQCLVWMTAVLSRVSLQTLLGEGFAPSIAPVSLRSSLPMFWPVLGLSLLQYVAASAVQTVLSVLYYLILIPIAFLGAEGGFGFVASVALSLLMFGVTALAYGYVALTVPALATEGRTAPDWIGKPLKPTTVITAFERAFRLIGLPNIVRVALVMAGAMAVSLALVGLLAAGLLALIALFATSIGQTVTAVVTNPWTIGGVIAFAAVLAMSAILAYVAAVQTLLSRPADAAGGIGPRTSVRRRAGAPALSSPARVLPPSVSTARRPTVAGLSGALIAIVLRAYDIPIVIGRDEARRRAEAELAKAKYGGTPGWVSRGLDRIERIARWLLDLLDRLASGPSAGGGINWGFLLAVTVLLAAIGVVVWRVGLPRWRKRSAPGGVEADPTVEAIDYRSRAETEAAAGDWRAAVRDRFRALVRELETRTILEVRPARTALEAAVGAARHLPALAGSLLSGAEEFNAVVYGERPSDEAAYRRMVALDDAVTAAADRVDLAADSEPTAVRS